MADPNKWWGDNVPGAFYVDDTCTDCDACRMTAPKNFDRNADEGHAFVAKQPENDEELEACTDAMDGCPHESIGSDGLFRSSTPVIYTPYISKKATCNHTVSQPEKVKRGFWVRFWDRLFGN